MNTLIVIILDESESMDSKKGDVLGGFNSFLKSQKEMTDDTARLYLVKFNTTVVTMHSGVPIQDVPELTDSSYTPGGCTALYDAIAEGVRIADRDKADDERVICVIMTDGEENSSRETTKEQVKDIITGHESRGDWTFLYIGEEPDRWARETGMQLDNVMAYNHADVRASCLAADKAVRKYRAGKMRQNLSLFKSLFK